MFQKTLEKSLECRNYSHSKGQCVHLYNELYAITTGKTKADDQIKSAFIVTDSE